MAEQDENNIPTAIDNLDYVPNIFAGFTAVELGSTFGVLLLANGVVLSIFTQFLFSLWVIGAILSILTAALETIWCAKKAYRLKAGRPSYLMWVDLQKRLQNEGIWGIKIPMGLVGTSHWHTGSKKGK